MVVDAARWLQEELGVEGLETELLQPEAAAVHRLSPAVADGQADEIDAQFIREAMAARDQHEGPGIGDFVRFPGGALHRLAVDFGERGFQTTEPDRGAFYLGGDSLVFSCGSPSLFPFVKKESLELLDETCGGEVWTFHHQETTPGGRVNAVVPFRVFGYTHDSAGNPAR